MIYMPISIHNTIPLNTNIEPLLEDDFLFLTSESLFISYTKTEQFRHLYSYLSDIIGSQYENEIWTFITNCGYILKRGGRGYFISLNRNHYQIANKIHRKGINRDRMSYVLTWLHDNDFIELKKGTWGSYQTCVILKQQVIDMFHLLTQHASDRPLTDLVVVKESHSGDIITNMSKFRGVRSLRNVVRSFNDLLACHSITLMGKSCSASYKRVYADSLSGAGRWYSFGGLQTMKSEYRKYLKIDNFKTTEVDYKSIHPNILYTCEGIEKPSYFDPYTVHGINGDINLIRSYAKNMMLCMLFADSEHKAKSAMINKYRNKDHINKEIVTKLTEELTKTNKEIAGYFYQKDLWKKLQHVDSSLTEYIIKEFIDREKPILPWHDSYVVIEEDRQLLIDTMRNAWLNTFQTDINFKYKVEF